MSKGDKVEEARKHVLAESEEPGNAVPVKGYDFDEGVDYDKLVDSFFQTGYQATQLANAIRIIREMREQKCLVYLGYTSNLVSSGLREIFCFLAKHRMVDVIVTTAGGVEEDIIKCFGDFVLGNFEASGVDLRQRGINRIGNIFVPNSRYCRFEDFMMPFLGKLRAEQKESGKAIAASEFVRRIGAEVNDERSICYWAQKNNIPVFCPALTDGSIGDMIYFFKKMQGADDFAIDIADDIRKLNDITFSAEKTGVIILGGGLVKHHILNTNLMRNGCDYAVYINTSHAFDGSEAGAPPEEAISWGKILPEAKSVKIFGDATILFPLIVAKTFAKECIKK